MKVIEGSKYASSPKYARVLNKLWFWIYQGSEYASGSKYARVFWIYLSCNIRKTFLRKYKKISFPEI